jgi:mannose-1-phosphate guanylyltransferase
MIEPSEVFQQAIKDALAFINANPDRMITFGIKPTSPSTQLGYIKCSAPKKCANCKNEIFTVDSFKEKPSEETARRYLAEGKYFWNSGMFVWKARTILAHINKYLPDAVEPLRKIAAAWDGPNQEQTLKDFFTKLPKISIAGRPRHKARLSLARPRLVRGAGRYNTVRQK